MIFSFHIPKPSNVPAAFEQLKKKLAAHKGRMTGNSTDGTITALGVTASYAVGNDTIEVKVLKKPALFTPQMVENVVRKIFRDIE